MNGLFRDAQRGNEKQRFFFYLSARAPPPARSCLFFSAHAKSRKKNIPPPLQIALDDPLIPIARDPRRLRRVALLALFTPFAVSGAQK